MQLEGRPAATILAVTITLAVIGQSYFASGDRYLGIGLALFAAAAVLFLVLTGRVGAGLSMVVRWLALVPPNVIRLFLVAIALGLNLLAVRFTLAPATSYWLAFWLWLAGAVFYAAAFVPRWPRLDWRALPGTVAEHGDEVVAVALCFVRGMPVKSK